MEKKKPHQITKQGQQDIFVDPGAAEKLPENELNFYQLRWSRCDLPF